MNLFTDFFRSLTRKRLLRVIHSLHPEFDVMAAEERINTYVWITKMVQTDSQQDLSPLLVSALRYQATRPSWSYLSELIDRDIELIDVRRQLSEYQDELAVQEQMVQAMASMNVVSLPIEATMSHLTAIEHRLN